MAASKEKKGVLPKPNCGFCGFGNRWELAGIENMKTRRRNAGREGDSPR